MLRKNISIFLIYISFITFCYANNAFNYPFYMGFTSGYGTSTWQGLVPSAKHQSLIMSLSTPIYVKEGGVVWGFFAGYEFNPFFALETSYLHYPNARVYFDETSIVANNYNELTKLVSHTEVVSVMAKIMLIVPQTFIRVFSSVGVAGVHRYDEITNHWRVSPTFGFGFNYNFTDHIMGELLGSFTAGYGESQLNPAQSYYPFLYGVYLQLGYRF